MAAGGARRLAVTLLVALALILGYASWRGWLPGVADYDRIETEQHR